MKSLNTRVEQDLLGNILVPKVALYGAQTQRAILNFPLNGEKTIGDYPTLIEALLLVKAAAAAANYKSGFLEKKKAAAIKRAVRSLLMKNPAFHFPIHHLHGGGGTSANMNANEVVANMAEEILGGKRGEYLIVNPLDHVNLHQSTNDVYPTACHLAIIRHWSVVEPRWRELEKAFREKGDELRSQKRIGRTCLQDAVDMTFKDLFRGYEGVIRRCRERIRLAVNQLYSVNLGGTVVGKTNGVPKNYFDRLILELRQAWEDEKITRNRNLFDAAQNADDIAAVSSSLSIFARVLIKISQDLRLLSSGPEAGFGEVRLPAVQPGSSCMPGKVNPVIPEFAIQLCCQVIGKNTACEMAIDHGELDLNIWESLMVFNVLDSLDHLAMALSALGGKCVKNLTVDSYKNTRNAETIIPQLSRLKEEYGFSNIEAICRRAKGDITKIKRLLKEN